MTVTVSLVACCGHGRGGGQWDGVDEHLTAWHFLLFLNGKHENFETFTFSHRDSCIFAVLFPMAFCCQKGKTEKQAKGQCLSSELYLLPTRCLPNMSPLTSPSGGSSSSHPSPRPLLLSKLFSLSPSPKPANPIDLKQAPRRDISLPPAAFLPNYAIYALLLRGDVRGAHILLLFYADHEREDILHTTNAFRFAILCAERSYTIQQPSCSVCWLTTVCNVRACFTVWRAGEKGHLIPALGRAALPTCRLGVTHALPVSLHARVANIFTDPRSTL